MTPDISIIVPSLHCDLGRRTLRVCTQCLVDNTINSYELLISSHLAESATNAYTYFSDVARGKYLAVLCDDIYVAPGWDEAFLSVMESDTLLIGSQIESGNMMVHECNIEFDHGRTPEEFRRAEFEAMAASHTVPAPETALDYWGFPWFVERELFARRWAAEAVKGTGREIMSDMYFWRSWREAGLKVKRAPSWSYHLMRWTGRDYDYLTGQPR